MASPATTSAAALLLGDLPAEKHDDPVDVDNRTASAAAIALRGFATDVAVHEVVGVVLLSFPLPPASSTNWSRNESMEFSC